MTGIGRVSAALLLILLLAGCHVAQVHTTGDLATAARLDECGAAPAAYNPSAAQLERDHIFMLVAYGVVFKDWQTSGWDDPTSRGYNIGGVLVDADQRLVCWSRNSNIITRNSTQHGEVRLMTNYLHNSKATSLKARRGGDGYTLYTTLEPCAMCSGMMTLQSLTRTIYGQTDPTFGKAIARLVLNSTSLRDGHCPYPRGVQSIRSDIETRDKLDQAFADAGGGNITEWLTSATAENLYSRAAQELEQFDVQFAENQTVLQEARGFLAHVPSEYRAIPYLEECSGAP